MGKIIKFQFFLSFQSSERAKKSQNHVKERKKTYNFGKKICFT